MNNQEKDPIKNDARKARKERHLGESTECVFCGATEPEALCRKSVSLLEEHHVAGRANDADLLFTHCRNCHDRIHERYRQNGVDLSAGQDRTPLERLIVFLRAVGTFLCQLGETMAGQADWLSQFMPKLDSEFPKWRDLALELAHDA